jgi:small subunit ribosomal protein S21
MLPERTGSEAEQARSTLVSQRDPWHHTLEVRIDGRGVESAIRLFKKLILRDGILREFKRRARYEKPGEKRRRKAREAARRRRRQRARALRREQGDYLLSR